MVTLSPPPHKGLTSLIILSIASRATAMIKLARMIDANLIAISHAIRRAQVARAHHGYCYTPCVRAIDLRLTVGVRECGLCRKLFNERLVSVSSTYCAARMSWESHTEASLGRADAPRANHPHHLRVPFRLGLPCR